LTPSVRAQKEARRSYDDRKQPQHQPAENVIGMHANQARLNLPIPAQFSVRLPTVGYLDDVISERSQTRAESAEEPAFSCSAGVFLLL
jgi:hypothetical protein